MLTHFLEDLSQRPHTEDSFNPYFSGDGWGAVRSRNLQRYFSTLRQRQPLMLMLMEAPGYRGCRVTGIPVTSRKVMLGGALGEGYEDTHETGFEAYHGEQSATIVWETLGMLGVLPVIWNAFPFHPHQIGNLQSNRTPRSSEIQEGLGYVQTICDIFQPQHCIAVGNIAAKAFTQLNIAYTLVRHPAQGGKKDFVEGMREIFKKE